jgi:hypothetical protein
MNAQPAARVAKSLFWTGSENYVADRVMAAACPS